MKIAVTYEKWTGIPAFRTYGTKFKVYDVEDGKDYGKPSCRYQWAGPWRISRFLANGNIDVLICGGIGGGARNALAEAGIKLFPARRETQMRR